MGSERRPGIGLRSSPEALRELVSNVTSQNLQHSQHFRQELRLVLFRIRGRKFFYLARLRRVALHPARQLLTRARSVATVSGQIKRAALRRQAFAESPGLVAVWLRCAPTWRQRSSCNVFVLMKVEEPPDLNRGA